MVKNKFSRVLRNLFFVPKCMSCKRRLSAFYKENASLSAMLVSDRLCEDCASEWEISLSRLCPDCKLETSRCLCSPKDFSRIAKKSEGRVVDALPKLVRYDPDTSSVANRVVLSIKSVDDTRSFEFLADAMATPLCKILSLERIPPEECVFTFVPRSSKRKSENGFDQSKRLCRELARVCGGEYRPLFFHTGSKIQKKLGAAERRENVRKNVRALRGAKKRVEGKNVVVVDDLVTTGATLGMSAQMLSELGARRVVCVCAARSK